MLAKLIAPDGEVTELTLDQYIQLRLTLIDNLPTKQERLLAVLDLINETHTPEDNQWWAEFDEFLAANRFTLRLPGNELTFDE